MGSPSPSRLIGYLVRFTLTHVVTYLVFGLTFMFLAKYREHWGSDEMRGLMRPLDSPIVQAAVLFQFGRGAFLGLVIYPCHDVVVRSPRGWLKLWALLWGLTLIGSVTTAGGSIEGLIYTQLSLKSHLIGIPEVTLQMLGFSWLFVAWERRKALSAAVPS
ncbi:MAG: hypothetical protein QM765_30585 [Myxococcales bacterium]